MFRQVIVAVVVAFGLQIALTLLAVIVYDLTALRTGRETISEAVLDLGRDHTGFAVLVAAELALAAGLLLGHLLFGQAVREHAVRRERQRCVLVLRSLGHERQARLIGHGPAEPPRGRRHNRDPPDPA